MRNVDKEVERKFGTVSSKNKISFTSVTRHEQRNAVYLETS